MTPIRKTNTGHRPVLLVFVVLLVFLAVFLAVVVGQEGVVVALFVVEERLDIFFCKNEAIFGWIVGKSFVFSEGESREAFQRWASSSERRSFWSWRSCLSVLSKLRVRR